MVYTILHYYNTKNLLKNHRKYVGCTRKTDLENFIKSKHTICVKHELFVPVFISFILEKKNLKSR